MKRLLVFVPLLAIAAIAALIFLAVSKEDPDAADQINLQRRAILDSQVVRLGENYLPTAEISSLQALSEAFSSAGTKPVVVNFFASWCVPCRAEHPNLMDYVAKGHIHLIGVSYKDKPEATAKFLKELGDPYDFILSDQSGRMGIDWGLSGVPETYVLLSERAYWGKIKGPIISEVTEKRFYELLNRGGK